MESNNELKKIDIKNCTCYYFDNIMRVENFHFDNIWQFINQNHMTFHTKLLCVQNHSVLGSIK